MTIEKTQRIDTINSPQTLQRNPLGNASTYATPVTTTNIEPTVQLTNASTQGLYDTRHDINHLKVNALKQAINSGSYSVDSDKIADALLSTYQDK